MADNAFDTKGLACPLPVPNAHKFLAKLLTGTILKPLVPDPGSGPNFKGYCDTTGNRLLAFTQSGGAYRFLVQHSA